MSAGDIEDTLQMLQAASEAFAQPDARRTRASRDSHQGFDRAVWSELAQMGWLAPMVPQQRGGLGLGLPAATIIARRLGYAGYLEPYVGVAVVAAACLSAAEPHARTDVLGSILDGTRLAALAWQPPDGRIEPDATGVVARDMAGGGTRVSGECRFITVPQSDAFIVAARSDGDLRLYWIERGRPGARVGGERAADGTVLDRLVLADVELAPDALIASGPDAMGAIEDALDAGLVASGAELLGVIERSLDLTIEYLKTRHQFGQPIGAFQALQHRAVDMWIQKELTRAALRSALKAYEASPFDRRAARAAASSLKARASQAALYVCGQAVQLHGAIGYTDEYELGCYVNRALTLAAMFGNAAVHRRRHAELAPLDAR